MLSYENVCVPWCLVATCWLDRAGSLGGFFSVSFLVHIRTRCLTRPDPPDPSWRVRGSNETGSLDGSLYVSVRARERVLSSDPRSEHMGLRIAACWSLVNRFLPLTHAGTQKKISLIFHCCHLLNLEVVSSLQCFVSCETEPGGCSGYHVRVFHSCRFWVYSTWWHFNLLHLDFHLLVSQISLCVTF